MTESPSPDQTDPDPPTSDEQSLGNAPSPDGPPPPGSVTLSSISMPTAIRWAAAILLLASLALVMYLLRYAMLPFVAAGALALILSPVVGWLHHRFRWPHWLAALTAVLAILLFFAAIGWAIKGLLIPQIMDFAHNGPQAVETMLHKTYPSGKIHFAGADIPINNLADKARKGVASMITAANLAWAAGDAFAALVGAFLTFLLTAYFLFTGNQFGRKMLWAVPPSRRDQVLRLTTQVVPMLRRYLVGVLVIAAYAMLLTWLVTQFALHVPHAPLLAVAVGLLELIPVVGPIASLLLVGGVAIMNGHGLGELIGFAIFATGLRLSIDQMIAPLVLGQSTSLPPPVIVFAFLTGGVLFGVVGVVLAVPVVAGIKIVMRDFYEGPLRSES